MTDFLYRVRITEFPDGAAEFRRTGDADGESYWVIVADWSPPGWKPEGNYVEMLGTTRFIWPSTKNIYRSRSTAKKRTQLLESFGATVAIERSSKITWPDTCDPFVVGEQLQRAERELPQFDGIG